MITLVLLPGMDGTGELYEPFIAALGPEFTVKIVRYPTDEPLDYSELESVARAALPTDEPFILVGESFSGPIAISLAASGFPQLKGLVLCCTFVRNPRPLSSVLHRFVQFLPVAFVPVRVLSFFLLGNFTTATLRSRLTRALAQVSPSVVRARLKAVLSVDVSAQYAASNVPTLYLHASHDRVVSASASALISQLNPRTYVVQLDAPHFLLQAIPVKAAQVMGAFVRRLSCVQGPGADVA